MKMTIEEFLKRCEEGEWDYRLEDSCDDAKGFPDEDTYYFDFHAVATFQPDRSLQVKSRAFAEIETGENGELLSIELSDTWEQRFTSGTQLSMHFHPVYRGADFALVDADGSDHHPIDCEHEDQPGGIFYRALSREAVRKICTTEKKLLAYITQHVLNT